MLTKSALPIRLLCRCLSIHIIQVEKKMQKKYFRDVKIRNNEKVFL
jgi:hypothetical protein